jgi:hypothetical protein
MSAQNHLHAGPLHVLTMGVRGWVEDVRRMLRSQPFPASVPENPLAVDAREALMYWCCKRVPGLEPQWSAEPVWQDSQWRTTLISSFKRHLSELLPPILPSWIGHIQCRNPVSQRQRRA